MPTAHMSAMPNDSIDASSAHSDARCFLRSASRIPNNLHVMYPPYVKGRLDADCVARTAYNDANIVVMETLAEQVLIPEYADRVVSIDVISIGLRCVMSVTTVRHNSTDQTVYVVRVVVDGCDFSGHSLPSAKLSTHLAAGTLNCNTRNARNATDANSCETPEDILSRSTTAASVINGIATACTAGPLIHICRVRDVELPLHTHLVSVVVEVHAHSLGTNVWRLVRTTCPSRTHQASKLCKESLARMRPGEREQHTIPGLANAASAYDEAVDTWVAGTMVPVSEAVGEALDRLSRAGIAHNDFSLTNVVLVRRPATENVYGIQVIDYERCTVDGDALEWVLAQSEQGRIPDVAVLSYGMARPRGVIDGKTAVGILCDKPRLLLQTTIDTRKRKLYELDDDEGPDEPVDYEQMPGIMDVYAHYAKGKDRETQKHPYNVAVYTMIRTYIQQCLMDMSVRQLHSIALECRKALGVSCHWFLLLMDRVLYAHVMCDAVLREMVPEDVLAAEVRCRAEAANTLDETEWRIGIDDWKRFFIAADDLCSDILAGALDLIPAKVMARIHEERRAPDDRREYGSVNGDGGDEVLPMEV